MPINLHISPRIITSIASLYNDVNRIFLEYIDNSIDSAEKFYDSKLESYSRNILVDLIIIGDNYKTGKVEIIDNCTGIINLPKVVNSIGNSDKKNQPWTNGQFGYGIYSFMAACNKLEIETREEYNEGFYLPILKKQFLVEKQDQVKFPDPKLIDFQYPAGTKISLSGFDKNSWKQIDINLLKEEIETHFELLLKRNNIKIRILKQSGSLIEKDLSFVCESFDYKSLDGKILIEKQLNSLQIRKPGDKEKLIETQIESPINIYLFLMKGKLINKPPVFICKGRRIDSIKNIKSFKSSNKQSIWGNPYLTGYIDLGDYLDPTIARNDFRNNYRSKALYDTIGLIEELILKKLKKLSVVAEQNHYKKLEQKLTQTLSKIARLDSLKLRDEIVQGDEINLEMNKKGLSLSDEEIERKKIGEAEDFETEQKEQEIDINIESSGGAQPGGEEDGNKAGNKENNTESDIKGRKRRKSGFNIIISDEEPPIDTIDNTPCRSILLDNEIVIFKNHKDFRSRVSQSRKGEKKITHSLIVYLAGEIAIYYKDVYFQKNKQTKYDIKLFKEVVDFVYKFEELLKDLVNKNLSDIKI